MEKEKQKGLFNQQAIDKLRKEGNKYLDLYVALDDRDRIITYGKNKKDVFEEAENFGFWNKEYGFRIYKTRSDFVRGMIKGLVD